MCNRECNWSSFLGVSKSCADKLSQNAQRFASWSSSLVRELKGSRSTLTSRQTEREVNLNHQIMTDLRIHRQHPSVAPSCAEPCSYCGPPAFHGRFRAAMRSALLCSMLQRARPTDLGAFVSVLARPADAFARGPHQRLIQPQTEPGSGPWQNGSPHSPTCRDSEPTCQCCSRRLRRCRRQCHQHRCLQLRRCCARRARRARHPQTALVARASRSKP